MLTRENIHYIFLSKKEVFSVQFNPSLSICIFYVLKKIKGL